MQRRTPPPNGIQVLVGGFWPRNRSGRNTSGSGWWSDRAWLTMIDGPTVAPAGRSQPAMVAGFISVRATIGITGCSRIDSLSTASSQASSPSTTARWVRSRSVGRAADLVQRPGQRGGGGLVAGEQQRHELVAQLDVGERVALLGGADDETGEHVGALVQVGRHPALTDLGEHQLVELALVVDGALPDAVLLEPRVGPAEQHRRADVDRGVHPRPQRREPPPRR